MQSPCPSVHTFITDISASTGRNDFIFDIWFWHGDLYCVFPYPGLLHIYFLFTVRLTNERVGVFLARRSVQHLVDITVIRQTDSTFDSPFYSLATKSRGGILIYPCPSVRASRYIDTWFVRLSPPTVLELQL